MHGSLSYFTLHTLTQSEIDCCLTLMATTENIEWNSYSEEFLQHEIAYDLKQES